MSFDDVEEGRFFALPVDWLEFQEITTGTSPSTFSPDQVVTRGQMAAFLWRFAGRPAGSPHGFVDVPAGAFYAEAVGWLAASGITTGTSSTTFSPESPAGRARIAPCGVMTNRSAQNI